MYLQHEKGIAKNEMSECLQAYAKKDVVDIIVHKDQIHTILAWEHEREFELSGIMYDVISSQIMGDSIIYQCLHDAKDEVGQCRCWNELVMQQPAQCPVQRLCRSQQHVLAPQCLNREPQHRRCGDALVAK